MSKRRTKTTVSPSGPQRTICHPQRPLTQKPTNCRRRSAEEPTKRTLFGGRADAGGDAAAAAAGRPVEYPLYCTSRRERPQFAIGVFLLNKNVVQLLQVWGEQAGGGGRARWKGGGACWRGSSALIRSVAGQVCSAQRARRATTVPGACPQVHGISAGGPNQLLHNLYKLLLAAQTALPGG